ncbi:MAG TPA: hypothetical protein VIV54_09540 [Burkholderiales bacterium]
MSKLANSALLHAAVNFPLFEFIKTLLPALRVACHIQLGAQASAGWPIEIILPLKAEYGIAKAGVVGTATIGGVEVGASRQQSDS